MGINRAITIDCTDTLDTDSQRSGEIDAIVVNAGANDRVTIRGLRVHNLTTNDGIIVYKVGVLTLDQMRIVGTAENTPASGIYFNPNSAGGKLVVNDTIILHAGNSAGGAGIRIYPTSGGTAQILLNRVTISGSTFGLALDGSNSTGGINATVSDSVFSANTNDGIVATTSAGAAPIGVNVSGSTMSNNGYGVRSIGSNVTVRVDNSRITGNGAALTASGGGTLLTGGGNTIQANAVKGSFTGSYVLE